MMFEEHSCVRQLYVGKGRVLQKGRNEFQFTTSLYFLSIVILDNYSIKLILMVGGYNDYADIEITSLRLS